MKKFFEKKYVLILGLVSILLLVLLVSGMGGQVFKQVVPIAIEHENVTGGGSWVPPQIPYLAIILVFAALMITIYNLLPKDQRRRYLLGLLGFLVVGLLILFFISRSTTFGDLPQPSPGLATRATPIVTDLPETPLPDVTSPVYTPPVIPDATPPVYTPPVIPAWTSFLVALAVFIPVGIGIWWLTFRRSHPDAPYDEISEIAQDALDDVDAGKDWGDTVLNCYYQMTRAVKGQRGFEWSGYLTPSEFVSVLEQLRLPGDPLRRLTTLFERVRYGGKQSTQKDIDEAVGCLTEIIEACKEVVL
jgi:hypothetical protein